MSPDGWLPDRISVGVLTRAFPPKLVDEVVEVTGTLRVVSMDGSVTDVPDSGKNAAFFGRPSNQSRDGGIPAGPVGGSGRVRDREPAGRSAAIPAEAA